MSKNLYLGNGHVIDRDGKVSAFGTNWLQERRTGEWRVDALSNDKVTVFVKLEEATLSLLILPVGMVEWPRVRRSPQQSCVGNCRKRRSKPASIVWYPIDHSAILVW
jgi:hypothetical protein